MHTAQGLLMLPKRVGGGGGVGAGQAYGICAPWAMSCAAAVPLLSACLCPIARTHTPVLLLRQDQRALHYLQIQLYRMPRQRLL